MDDVENAARLIAAFARRLPGRHHARAVSVLLLLDIDGTLLIPVRGEHAMALHDATELTWRVDLREVRVEIGGRNDPDTREDRRRYHRRGDVDALDRVPGGRPFASRSSSWTTSDRLAPAPRRPRALAGDPGCGSPDRERRGVARLKLQAGIGGT